MASFGRFGTAEFLRALGKPLSFDPEPFIEWEGLTTLKLSWALWRSVTRDFFATATFGIVAGVTYARGVHRYLEHELGLPCRFAAQRVPGGNTDNPAIRELVQKKNPARAVRQLRRAGVAVPDRRPHGFRAGLVAGNDHPPAPPAFCRRCATRWSTRWSTSCRSATRSIGSTRRRRRSSRPYPGRRQLVGPSKRSWSASRP